MRKSATKLLKNCVVLFFWHAISLSIASVAKCLANKNSGHICLTKVKLVALHCHSKKSDNRTSPEVRTRRSTGKELLNFLLVDSLRNFANSHCNLVPGRVGNTNITSHRRVHFIVRTLEVFNAERIDTYFLDVHEKTPAQSLLIEKVVKKVIFVWLMGYFDQFVESGHVSLYFFDVLEFGVAPIAVHDNCNMFGYWTIEQNVTKYPLNPCSSIVNEPTFLIFFLNFELNFMLVKFKYV
ncbi:hypothetical protein BpHYR1_044392 [Brachionus plicatilis]|uniref:Uncharacterized protein n=1 Tax=Brachionus plicatilis TaxID=10195 RepID=A0A3M7SVN3_BRAPC|nr:hypothetical protein BpHYR1_044392 [Brachionus plicatilis]